MEVDYAVHACRHAPQRAGDWVAGVTSPDGPGAVAHPSWSR